MFLAWRKRITARISELAGLSIAGHNATHSVETRTNTTWPGMWWFTRQWVMWHYLACASSPPLLHFLPKINGCYFPNSPRTFQHYRFLDSELLILYFKFPDLRYAEVYRCELKAKRCQDNHQSPISLQEIRQSSSPLSTQQNGITSFHSVTLHMCVCNDNTCSGSHGNVKCRCDTLELVPNLMSNWNCPRN
jgi:hypothetical protein